MNAPDPHQVVAAVWKRESATVVGALMRLVRDVGLAEEMAQDALVAALVEWPRSGVPDRPGAWLITTARNRALNAMRRARMAEGKHEALRHAPPPEEPAIDLDLRDDVLRLVFTACHPALSPEGRAALTLRLVGGLSTEEIARAYLVAESTIAQRIVRAKRALAGAAYEVPPDELGARLASVLKVVYLLFNEGYAPSGGDEVVRPALMREAVRLGALLTGLAPGEPEVLGLAALMELQASRADARVDPNGDPVLLADQDRARWDRDRIGRGLAALARAESLGGSPGPYQLQAAIAAVHARAASVEDTDWARIAALYGQLGPSPVVALNRAMAVSRAEGPAAGLALLDGLGEALGRYPWLPAARAELLERLDRTEEARAEFERAAGLSANTRARDRLLARAERLGR